MNVPIQKQFMITTALSLTHWSLYLPNIQIIPLIFGCVTYDHISHRGWMLRNFWIIYIYQKECPFMICEDFNSQVGDNTDYIKEMDDIPERSVLHFESNTYCDRFLDLCSG